MAYLDRLVDPGEVGRQLIWQCMSDNHVKHGPRIWYLLSRGIDMCLKYTKPMLHVDYMLSTFISYYYSKTSITRDCRGPDCRDRELSAVAIIELFLLKIWEKKILKIGLIIKELELKMWTNVIWCCESTKLGIFYSSTYIYIYIYIYIYLYIILYNIIYSVYVYISAINSYWERAP